MHLKRSSFCHAYLYLLVLPPLSVPFNIVLSRYVSFPTSASATSCTSTPLHSLLFHLCPDDMCSHATDILYCSILCTHSILALYGWPAVLCTYFCLYIVRVQVQYIHCYVRFFTISQKLSDQDPHYPLCQSHLLKRFFSLCSFFFPPPLKYSACNYVRVSHIRVSE